MHPARKIDFDTLYQGLLSRVEKKYIYEKESGDMRLYVYSQNCTFDGAWDDYTTLARGLILDIKQKKVLATPFPKFFNYGERPSQNIPKGSVNVTTKHDGSLIILFQNSNGTWRCATKGSFSSEQAISAEFWAYQNLNMKNLKNGYTYLFEWVSPENKIVIPYKKDELILLGVYDNNGVEYSYQDLVEVSRKMNCRLTEVHEFNHIIEVINYASKLPFDQEGYVLRFGDFRLKIKGDEYKRIHSLISRCTPLAMWEAMMLSDDMMEIRKQLPEEFWVDFDNIIRLLKKRLIEILNRTYEEFYLTKNMSDKEVGLVLDKLDPVSIKFIWGFRRKQIVLEENTYKVYNSKMFESLFRHIRPTSNVLEGYIPSYAMNRVFQENLDG